MGWAGAEATPAAHARRVVYMDEPSTGLDPASRRNLWDVVKAAKENKASGSSYGSHGAQDCERGCGLRLRAHGTHPPSPTLFAGGHPDDALDAGGGGALRSLGDLRGRRALYDREPARHHGCASMPTAGVPIIALPAPPVGWLPADSFINDYRVCSQPATVATCSSRSPRPRTKWSAPQPWPNPSTCQQSSSTTSGARRSSNCPPTRSCFPPSSRRVSASRLGSGRLSQSLCSAPCPVSGSTCEHRTPTPPRRAGGGGRAVAGSSGGGLGRAECVAGRRVHRHCAVSQRAVARPQGIGHPS